MSASAIHAIGSAAELVALRARLRTKSPCARCGGTRQILVCFGGSCLASGAREVRDALHLALVAEGLAGEVALVETGCMGPCVVGPVVLVGEDRTFYQGVKPEDAADIVRQHVVEGRRVERLLVHDASGAAPAPTLPIASLIPASIFLIRADSSSRSGPGAAPCQSSW